ncbi:MAG: cytochrome c [Nitrospina sp.]|nr:cytochrome c [Nitrospina sp.]
MNKKTFLELLIKTIQVSMLLAFMFFLGCSSERKPHQAQAKKTDVIVQKELQSMMDVSSVTEKTRQVYRRYCAQCHGVKGHGDGINAPYLVVPPRDHTKSDYLETRSDQQLFDAIKLGGLAVGRAPCMPAWEHTFESETIRSLVNYIRELCNCKAL